MPNTIDMEALNIITAHTLAFKLKKAKKVLCKPVKENQHGTSNTAL